MRKPTHLLSFFRQAAAFGAAFLLAVAAASAQVSGGTDVNLSQKTGDDNECAIAVNPANNLRLFAVCNTSSPGLFAARSLDGGITWIYPATSKTIANGTAGLGPAACCDPSLAWDNFGNLFITYLGKKVNTVETILSTDGGATFMHLATFGPASVDQPTVVAGSGAVWIAWNQSGSMVAQGAAVTGLGKANIGDFGVLQLQKIPGTKHCSFGDIAIAPSGAVVQTCQSPTAGEGPSTIFVNIKADGLGPNPFGPAITATATNVGGFRPIPAQSRRTIDAEAGLAYDRNPLSRHFGRLYLVYTDIPAPAPAVGNNDTDIMLRFSDDNGATWRNPPIRVNDDATNNSQFLPRIASDPLSGNIAVCWHDCRNSATNTAIEEFCTIATPTGLTPAFMANAQIGDALSTSNGAGIEFGDYSGLAYFRGVAHPIWADTSNSTGDNPDATPNGAANFDAYTDQVQ